MKQLRIAFVLSSFPTLSETFIYTQIAYLLKQGYDVHIFAYNKSRETIIHSVISDNSLMEKCTFFPSDRIRRVKRMLYRIVKQMLKSSGLFAYRKQHDLERQRIIAIFTGLKAEKWFQGYKPFDIIHVHHGIVGIPIANMLAEHVLTNTKLVVTFHGYDLDPSCLNHYKTLYNKLFEVSDALTVNTPYLEQILFSICSHPEKVIQLPVGLDITQFKLSSPSKPRLQEEPMRILFCGRLIRWKGPDLAIQIIYHLIHSLNVPNIKLDIIGNGPLENTLKDLMNKLNLNLHVRILGGMSQEELIKNMLHSHLFLLPGIHDPDTGRAETQGLVIQEAQAMGLPVLVSDAGGMQYGMVDGTTGYVIEAGDIEAFATRIAYLFHHEEERQTMGIAAREYVSANYDIRYLGEKLERIYQQILSK